MENSIEKDEEILNNIKAYMQENIDKGYHKFVYNDLGYDEKCVDVINAIEYILSDYKRVLKENEKLKVLDSSNSKMIANMSTRHFQDREKIRNSIPIQKIKDKIEQYNKILLNCNCFSDVDRIKAINERILELQTLLKNNKN